MRRLAVVVALCTLTTEALAGQPVPHEAVYDLTVKNWKLPSEISNVNGSQIIRLERSCTDWTTVAAFHLAADTANGDDIDFETSFQGIEALDGTQLKFRNITKANGDVLEVLQGLASRPAVGQPGQIVVEEPTDTVLPLPADVLFPVAAFQKTAAQWERGERNLNYVLFDGTTPDIVRVFEFLTGTATVTTPIPEGDTALVAGTAWKSTGSLHAYDSAAAEPLTSLSQVVLPNGITTELSIDIGFADVVMHLRRIRALPQPAC